jgi:hypothetical protein
VVARFGRPQWRGVAAAAALCATPPLSAQDRVGSAAPAGICYHARPQPACSAFILTNAGLYSGSATTPQGENTLALRVLAEWGYMKNTGPHNAIGLALFASGEDFAGGEMDFAVGPAVHYRRWLAPPGSLDVGLGMALGNATIKGGSVFGLAKWNPNNWIGVAVRPEVIRRTVTVGCANPPVCDQASGFGTRSRARLSVGVELGDLPGLVLTPLAFGFALLVSVVSGGGN